MLRGQWDREDKCEQREKVRTPLAQAGEDGGPGELQLGKVSWGWVLEKAPTRLADELMRG